MSDNNDEYLNIAAIPYTLASKLKVSTFDSVLLELNNCGNDNDDWSWCVILEALVSSPPPQHHHHRYYDSIDCEQQQHQETLRKAKITYQISLHPTLTEFLEGISSYILLSLSNNNEKKEEHTNNNDVDTIIEEEKKNESSVVYISSDHHSSICPSSFILNKINPNCIVNDETLEECFDYDSIENSSSTPNNQPTLIICRLLLHGTSSKDDEQDQDLFSMTSTTALQEEVQERLQYQVITKDSIIPILVDDDFSANCISEIVMKNVNHNTDGNLHHHDNSVILFLIVEEIISPLSSQQQREEDELTNTTLSLERETKHRQNQRVFYRLGSSNSFNLNMILPPTTSNDTNHDTMTPLSSLDSQPQKEEEEEEVVQEKQQQTSNHTIIPGYKHLLLQLFELASFTCSNSSHPSQIISFPNNVSPTAVLLTGCCGVGKTFLANTFLNQIYQFQANNRNHSNTMIQRRYISCRDILLMVSSSISSLTSLDVMEYIIPSTIISFLSSSSDEEEIKQLILVIDDLQILFQGDYDSSDENSTLDRDCAMILYSIKTTIEMLSKRKFPGGEGEGKVFFLGICQTSSTFSTQQINQHFVSIGHFEKVLEMNSPTQSQREDILYHILEQMMVLNTTHNNNNQNYAELQQQKEKIERWAIALATQTCGCVASDLKTICSNAFVRAATRTTTRNKRAAVGSDEDDNNDYEENYTTAKASEMMTWEDLKESSRTIIPFQFLQLDISVIRPTNSLSIQQTQDPTNLNDWKHHLDDCWNTSFAGYHDMKKKLYRTVIGPWRRLQKHKHDNNNNKNDDISSSPSFSSDLLPTGVLFHGPSGCGKTHVVVNCLAKILQLNLLKVKSSDILNPWLGGSESILRQIFKSAQQAAPCILFLDEIDSLANNRAGVSSSGGDNDDSGGGGSDVHSRILSTLLNEMDGVGGSAKVDRNNDGGVLIVAATNLLENIDAALLRPGRLSQHILLDLPTRDDCLEILQWFLLSHNIICEKKNPNSNENEKDKDNTENTKRNNLDLVLIANEIFNHKMSGADIEGLCREACFNAIRRKTITIASDDSTENDLSLNNKDMLVDMKDFEHAFNVIQVDPEKRVDFSKL